MKTKKYIRAYKQYQYEEIFCLCLYVWLDCGMRVVSSNDLYFSENEVVGDIEYERVAIKSPLTTMELIQFIDSVSIGYDYEGLIFPLNSILGD